jgi:putrescine transport system substrate-binding protein
MRGAGAIAAAVLLMLCGAADAQQAKQRIVNVYNWSDYIDPAVLEDFTRETGIKVKYDTFDSNDMLETKLLAGRTGYDVVVPTAYFLARQIKAGVFQKLDKGKLPNLKNAWDDIAARLAVYDPGNQYAVNYMWGTTGIGYNARKAREVLGAEGTIDSWDVVFKPEAIAKFKDCGVHVLDAADDVFAAALAYLKLDPNTKEQADLEKAADLLTKIRPFVRKFHSSEYLECARIGRDLPRARLLRRRQAGAEARRGSKGRHRDRYAIPKEGAQLWFDNLAIPKDAKNVAEAHALIDYLLRPDVAAKNSNVISYANGNAASRALIDKAIIDDKTVYPDDATMKTFYTIQSHDQKTQRLMNRLWTRIKTGR